jgi:hypothetical protein
MQPEPEFPFQLVWLETGEVETYTDADDLMCNLEDFDSTTRRIGARPESPMLVVAQSGWWFAFGRIVATTPSRRP